MNLKKQIIKHSFGDLSGYTYEYYKNTKGYFHGPYTLFYPNGQKNWESSFIFGNRIGVSKYYRSDGRRWCLSTWKSGKRGIRIDFK